MQDLRQDLRQHQDYGDGGSGSWRGGRGGGGHGGRGGGADFRGRGSFYDKHEKYARVQQMRKESRASMRRRIIQSLDISGTMTAPSVLAARDDVLSTPHASAAAHTGVSSFDQQPYEPRTIMHDAYHTREPPLHSCILSDGNVNSSTVDVGAQQQQQQLDAGDLAVALETAIEACRDGEERSQLIRSKIGGQFLARPDQKELVRKSSSTNKR
ncbi:hypothetical protein Ndes2526B_g02010 [Nannochloris sp. 'desiccata']|nr:hypothetical protein KSW81_005538 [Chlorella desiccata (nom. nud.)]KAH7623565.1 hypothetical protein NADE_002752 [Chlorella desiccata (nom. nud.)]